MSEKENKTKFKKLVDSEMCSIYNYNLSYNYIKILHKTCLSVSTNFMLVLNTPNKAS